MDSTDYDLDDNPEGETSLQLTLNFSETREQLESRYEEIMRKMAAYGIDVDDLLDHLDDDEGPYLKFCD